MEIICKQCKEIFNTSNKKRRFCSKSCVTKNTWSTGKIKAFGTDEYKQKISKIQREVQNRDDIKIKKSNALKKRWADPEKRESMTEAIINSIHNSNDRRSETLKTLWQNADFRKSQTIVCQKTLKASQHQRTIAILKKWQDPEYKKRMQLINKEVQNRPEQKLIRSIRSLEMWKKPGFAEHHMNVCFKYKEFVMPSGKIVKIQGYEPQALTDLLKIYSEEDIVIGVKEMIKEIGHITYMFDNNEHTYYPDFYIKSTNTIIEVKSQWTFDKHKEITLAKQKACLEQGYNFVFKIL